MVEITTPFINIQTDFGFKFVFGTKKNKKALIRFLNTLFDGKLTVTDVVYHDKEVLPSSQDGKRIIYDVYCTFPEQRGRSPFFPASQASDSRGSEKADHHFILEMQNIYMPPFEERIVFYASRMIAGQGKPGWNYELNPVFAIAVTDFNLSHMTPRLVRDVMLVDRDMMEPLTEKLHIYLCSLKEIPKTWEECGTDLAELLYIIKNIEKMDTTSAAYRSGKFREIFDAARSETLTEDELIPYSQSLDKLRDIQAGILYAADEARVKGYSEGREEGLAKGRAEGREEGRAEGLAKGRAEGRAEVISEKIERARELGLSADMITQLFGRVM